jgi:hypothetical protein
MICREKYRARSDFFEGRLRMTEPTNTITRRNRGDLTTADCMLRSFRVRAPLGFQAGDDNLYRYVNNSPVNETDPSGLQGGVNNHSYPLHLGGSALQPVIELYSQADHVAFHRFLREAGFPYGDAGRAAWARLNPRQQQALLIRALRAARVPNSVIRANIGRIMAGATPGVRTPRPAGYPGGRIILPVAAAAVADILLNPSVARAAEADTTWRGLPANTVGTAILYTQYVVIDVPSAWNLFGSQSVVRTWRSDTSALDLGEITVAEARQFEGLEDEFEDPTSSAPTGYTRIVRSYSTIDFTPVANAEPLPPARPGASIDPAHLQAIRQDIQGLESGRTLSSSYSDAYGSILPECMLHRVPMQADLPRLRAQLQAAEARR